MFKSIINSLNGHSKDIVLDDQKELESPKNGSTEKECTKTLDKPQKQSSKQTLGKRSKKRLSTMLGKIQSKMNNSSHTLQSNKVTKNNDNSYVLSSELDDNHINSDEDCQYYDFPAENEDELGGQEKANKNGGENEDDNDDEDEAKRGPLPEEQCDIPTFLHTQNCDQQLIKRTRELLIERYAKNPDSFYDEDYKRMLNDDWTVSRFLLRRREDPKRTAKLMEECGRFRKQYKMSEVQLWEFPIEFHKAGGLFMYAPDRVGNLTVYMRVRMYRRVPEISDVYKAFILCVLEQCDSANKGRGTAVIFDLSGCGLQNVDLGFLSWLLSSFRNYCPKGVSYIIVYNLPWILSATCKLAMSWMSASNRRALRFVYGDEIQNFISRENLPDYCGGTCKINYRSIPEGSKPAIEVCDQLDMTPEAALKIRELFKEYLDDEEDEISETKLSRDEKGSIVKNKTNGELRSNSTGTTGNEILAVSASTDLVSQASKYMA